jgi:hypothetical protein
MRIHINNEKKFTPLHKNKKAKLGLLNVYGTKELIPRNEFKFKFGRLDRKPGTLYSQWTQIKSN